MTPIRDQEALVEAIGRELQANQVAVGMSASEIATTVTGWIGSEPPYSAIFIAYGPSVALGVSFQVAVAAEGILYDFEFTEKNEHFYFIKLSKVETINCQLLNITDDKTVRQCAIFVGGGNSAARYTAIGDAQRIEAALRFYKDLSIAWRYARA